MQVSVLQHCSYPIIGIEWTGKGNNREITPHQTFVVYIAAVEQHASRWCCLIIMHITCYLLTA